MVMLFGDVKPLMVSLMALGEQLVEFSAVMMLADDDHSPRGKIVEESSQ